MPNGSLDNFSSAKKTILAVAVSIFFGTGIGTGTSHFMAPDTSTQLNSIQDTVETNRDDIIANTQSIAVINEQIETMDEVQRITLIEVRETNRNTSEIVGYLRMRELNDHL